MSTQDDLIAQIISVIDGSIAEFIKSIPEQQTRIFDEISLLVKTLDLSGDSIIQSTKNLRIIGNIKSKLDAIVNSPEWIGIVNNYIASFDEVTKLQNQYFSTLVEKFKPNVLLNEIKKQSIEATVNSLTEAGISFSVTDQVQNILRQNITTGSSYSQMMSQMRDFITTNQTGSGALERYTKQITTDALNQYVAQYTNAVTNDLGLNWFMYTGAIIDTSRALCRALINKKYIHQSELPDIVLGRFFEFEQIGGKLNHKTKLPEGMIPGTNASNFHIYRGGYQCGHQLIPIDSSSVPNFIRLRFERKSMLANANKNIPDNGSVFIKDFGDVKITKAGLKEAINQPHQNYSEKNKVIGVSLADALKRAKYVGSFPDSKNRPHIEKFHYFETSIAGLKSYIIIQERKDGSFIFHSIVDSIKKP